MGEKSTNAETMNEWPLKYGRRKFSGASPHVLFESILCCDCYNMQFKLFAAYFISISWIELIKIDGDNTRRWMHGV